MLKLVLLNKCNFKKRCVLNNQKKVVGLRKFYSWQFWSKQLFCPVLLKHTRSVAKDFCRLKNNNKIGKCSSNCKIHKGWEESVTAQRRIWLARADFITNGATPSYYHSELPWMFYKQCFSLNKIMFSWSFSRLFECPQRPKQLQPGRWTFHRIA